MRKFKSMKQAQRFPGTHAAVYNLFNLGRHLVSAETYRYRRLRAFATWEKAVAIYKCLIEVYLELVRQTYPLESDVGPKYLAPSKLKNSKS